MIIYDLEATFDANKFLDAAYAKKMHFIIKSQNDLHLFRYEKKQTTYFSFNITNDNFK